MGAPLANHVAISAVGEALRAHLESAYTGAIETAFPCTFTVLATGQLGEYDDPAETTNTAVTLFLYRVTVNEQLRNPLQPGRTPEGVLPALPLDLHWMISVWANSATAEHTVFAWVLRQLATQPLLDTTLLGAEANFADDEVLQVVPAELTIEDQMRVWDALAPSYRLSVTYVVRAVRIELDAPVGQPTIAIRLPFDTLDSVEGAS